MKTLIFVQTFLLFLLIQVSHNQRRNVRRTELGLQKRVEDLIVKILRLVDKYYEHVDGTTKCFPSIISDDLVAIIDRSVTCVELNENRYLSGKISRKRHNKNFLKCFSDAQDRVKAILENYDFSGSNCTKKVPEKHYQIKLTTSVTKVFNIDIEGEDNKYNRTILTKTKSKVENVHWRNQSNENVPIPSISANIHNDYLGPNGDIDNDADDYTVRKIFNQSSDLPEYDDDQEIRLYELDKPEITFKHRTEVNDSLPEDSVPEHYKHSEKNERGNSEIHRKDSLPSFITMGARAKLRS